VQFTRAYEILWAFYEFAAAKSSGKLDEKQRKALVSLLADEDPKVYRTVRQKILSSAPSRPNGCGNIA